MKEFAPGAYVSGPAYFNRKSEPGTRLHLVIDTEHGVFLRGDFIFSGRENADYTNVYGALDRQELNDLIRGANLEVASQEVDGIHISGEVGPDVLEQCEGTMPFRAELKFESMRAFTRDNLGHLLDLAGPGLRRSIIRELGRRGEG